MRALTIGLLLPALGCASTGLVEEGYQSSGNLVEYGCSFFGEGGFLGSLPPIGAPDLKVTADGRLITRDGMSNTTVVLEDAVLDRIRRRVAKVMSRHPRSALVEAKGRPLLMHGGLCYLSLGSEPTMLVTEVEPIGGAIGDLLDLLEQTNKRTGTRTRFRPSSVVISISEMESGVEKGAAPWPYTEELDLSTLDRDTAIEVTEPNVTSLFASWVMNSEKEFRLGDETVQVRILDIPGWYSPIARNQMLETVFGSTATRRSLHASNATKSSPTGVAQAPSLPAWASAIAERVNLTAAVKSTHDHSIGG